MEMSATEIIVIVRARDTPANAKLMIFINPELSGTSVTTTTVGTAMESGLMEKVIGARTVQVCFIFSITKPEK